MKSTKPSWKKIYNHRESQWDNRAYLTENIERSSVLPSSDSIAQHPSHAGSHSVSLDSVMLLTDGTIMVPDKHHHHHSHDHHHHGRHLAAAHHGMSTKTQHLSSPSRGGSHINGVHGHPSVNNTNSLISASTVSHAQPLNESASSQPLTASNSLGIFDSSYVEGPHQLPTVSHSTNSAYIADPLTEEAALAATAALATTQQDSSSPPTRNRAPTKLSTLLVNVDGDQTSVDVTASITDTGLPIVQHTSDSQRNNIMQGLYELESPADVELYYRFVTMLTKYDSFDKVIIICSDCVHSICSGIVYVLY